MSAERPSLIPVTETTQQREERLQAYAKVKESFNAVFRSYNFLVHGRDDHGLEHVNIYDYFEGNIDNNKPKYFVQRIEFPISKPAYYIISRWLNVEKLGEFYFGPREEKEFNEWERKDRDKDIDADVYTANIRICFTKGKLGFINNYFLDHNGILKRRTTIDDPKSEETFLANIPGKKEKVKVRGYRTPYSEVSTEEANELAAFLNSGGRDFEIIVHPRLNTTMEQEARIGLPGWALVELKGPNR